MEWQAPRSTAQLFYGSELLFIVRKHRANNGRYQAPLTKGEGRIPVRAVHAVFNRKLMLPARFSRQLEHKLTSRELLADALLLSGCSTGCSTTGAPQSTNSWVQAELVFGFGSIGFGSGTGIRTLNLAVNRSLQPVQK